MELNEDLCRQCSHQDVCRHRDDIRAVFDAIKLMKVQKDHSERGAVYTPIGKIEPVKSVEVRCAYFAKMVSTGVMRGS